MGASQKACCYVSGIFCDYGFTMGRGKRQLLNVNLAESKRYAAAARRAAFSARYFVLPNMAGFAIKNRRATAVKQNFEFFCLAGFAFAAEDHLPAFDQAYGN